MTEHDAKDLLERWQRALLTMSRQVVAAPPSARPAWEAARARAEAVVAALQAAAEAERAANRAWLRAREAERKGSPALRLVY